MKQKSFVVGIGMAAVLLLGSALGLSRWALLYRAPCDQPCRDLGHDPVPGRGPRDVRVCAPKCAPLKLDLELAEPTARSGKLYTLWYKITLKNVSCHELSGINAEAFFTARTIHGIGLYLQVRDPDGKEVVPESSSGVAFQGEYGKVYPYSIEHGAFSRFQSTSDLQMDDDGFVTMKPGATLVTAPSVVDPRKDGPISDGVRGNTINSAGTIERVNLEGIPPPPAGFRILDDYVFKKPGRYTIAAIDDLGYASGITATPIYPYAGLVPYPLRRCLRLLRLIDEKAVDPAARNSERYLVRVESPAVPFEVRR